MAAGIKR